jgi:hypothetical protein
MTTSEARRLSLKKYREKNLEQVRAMVLESAKKYYQKHKEELKPKNKEYYQQNKERMDNYHQEYVRRNRLKYNEESLARYHWLRYINNTSLPFENKTFRNILFEMSSE